MIYVLADILTDLVYFWYYKVWRYLSNIVIGIFYQLFSKEYKVKHTGTVIASSGNLHYLIILGDDGKEYQVFRNTYFIYLKGFNNLDLSGNFKVNDRVIFNKTHIKHRISYIQQSLSVKQQIINVKKMNKKDDFVKEVEGEVDYIEKKSEEKMLKEYVVFRFFIDGKEKLISLNYNDVVFNLKIEEELMSAKYGDKVIAKINTKNMMVLNVKFENK
tara:strand:- start:8959 stop:9606 length:648 start_codon:yes stop_codon:yes gene_type:complete